MEYRLGLGGLAVFGLGMAVAACGGSSKKAAGGTAGMGTTGSDEINVPKVDPALCDTKGKTIQEADLSKDGKPDVWKMFMTVEEGGTTIQVLTCKQVDLDHDGRKDYVITYDRTGAMLVEEFDFDFDGRFDARHFYDKNTSKVFLVERDSDYDKKPDIWEKYDANGKVTSVRRDRNQDEDPDVWETYENGQLVAILWDDDFDNKVDRKDEVKAPPKPAAPETPPPATGDGEGEPAEGEPTEGDATEGTEG